MHLKSLNIFVLAMLLIGATACTDRAVQQGEWDAYYEGVPFKTTLVVRPVFSNNVVNIIDYGAVGDGFTDNTEAINRAITELSQQGGGRVVIPAGVWFTGAIEIKSNIELHAERNALVIFNDDPQVYPIIETSFELFGVYIIS